MVQPVSDSHHRPASATEGALNTDEAWSDTGDELSTTPPCSPTSGNVAVMGKTSPRRTPSPGAYHSSNITLEVPPYPSHYPGGFREGWSTRKSDEKLGSYSADAVLGGIIRGHHKKMRSISLTPDGRTENRNGRIVRFPHREPSSYQSLSPDQSPGRFEVRNRRQMPLKRLQEAALVKTGNGKRCVKGGSGLVTASVAARNRESDKGGSGLGDGCSAWAIIQGYCNWLLDGNGPRVRRVVLLARQRARDLRSSTLPTRIHYCHPYGSAHSSFFFPRDTKYVEVTPM